MCFSSLNYISDESKNVLPPNFIHVTFSLSISLIQYYLMNFVHLILAKRLRSDSCEFCNQVHGLVFWPHPCNMRNVAKYNLTSFYLCFQIMLSDSSADKQKKKISSQNPRMLAILSMETPDVFLIIYMTTSIQTMKSHDFMPAFNYKVQASHLKNCFIVNNRSVDHSILQRQRVIREKYIIYYL